MVAESGAEAVALLWEAADGGRRDEVDRLLARGIDIDAVDGTGRTAALLAAENRDLDALRLLIEAGADINLNPPTTRLIDQLPLHVAGNTNQIDMVRLLIDAGADVTIPNGFGGTVLHPVAEQGHVEVARLLLERTGIDIDHVNALCLTALIEAVKFSDGGRRAQAMVALLVAHGARRDLADCDGRTARDHAVALGYAEMVAILDGGG